jgi:hypothetical protein
MARTGRDETRMLTSRLTGLWEKELDLVVGQMR